MLLAIGEIVTPKLCWALPWGPGGALPLGPTFTPSKGFRGCVPKTFRGDPFEQENKTDTGCLNAQERNTYIHKKCGLFGCGQPITAVSGPMVSRPPRKLDVPPAFQ